MDVSTVPENMLTTSGLSILMHGVISIPDATSCNKNVHGKSNLILKKAQIKKIN